ncbi:MAG: YlzJ-like family protein [Clostridia bacterium]|nr:YlzJ-like family protein [Clostridia bacterium]
MIFHSVIPIDVVMGNGYNNSIENSYVEMDYLGEKIQVSPLENNRYMINRLISTSPKAYLNPKLQPGTVIEK